MQGQGTLGTQCLRLILVTPCCYVFFTCQFRPLFLLVSLKYRNSPTSEATLAKKEIKQMCDYLGINGDLPSVLRYMLNAPGFAALCDGREDYGTHLGTCMLVAADAESGH